MTITVQYERYLIDELSRLLEIKEHISKKLDEAGLDQYNWILPELKTEITEKISEQIFRINEAKRELADQEPLNTKINNLLAVLNQQHDLVISANEKTKKYPKPYTYLKQLFSKEKEIIEEINKPKMPKLVNINELENLLKQSFILVCGKDDRFGSPPFYTYTPNNQLQLRWAINIKIRDQNELNNWNKAAINLVIKTFDDYKNEPVWTGGAYPYDQNFYYLSVIDANQKGKVAIAFIFPRERKDFVKNFYNLNKENMLKEIKHLIKLDELEAQAVNVPKLAADNIDSVLNDSLIFLFSNLGMLGGPGMHFRWANEILKKLDKKIRDDWIKRADSLKSWVYNHASYLSCDPGDKLKTEFNPNFRYFALSFIAGTDGAGRPATNNFVIVYRKEKENFVKEYLNDKKNQGELRGKLAEIVYRSIGKKIVEF